MGLDPTQQTPSSVGPTTSSRDRFWDKFRVDLTKLMHQMDKLEDMPDGPEKIDGLDHCLGGIMQLQRETELASPITTSHDKKIYADSIEALKERLRSLRSIKPRFAFKQKKSNPAVDVSALEYPEKQRPVTYSSLSTESSQVSTPMRALTPPTEKAALPSKDHASGTLRSFLHKAGVVDHSRPSEADRADAIRKLSFSQSKTVNINSHVGMHIVLPSSATHATKAGSVLGLRRCVINMGAPTIEGRPFASLTLKDIQQSLLICGAVAGPTHITDVRDSLILVKTRQFRMHECSNCVVYLEVSSRPIIEDCDAIQFAELPKIYSSSSDASPSPNLFAEVQDFKWHKTEPSPYWSMLPPEGRVSEEVWTEVVTGGPGWSTETILGASGVHKLSGKAESQN